MALGPWICKGLMASATETAESGVDMAAQKRRALQNGGEEFIRGKGGPANGHAAQARQANGRKRPNENGGIFIP